jgi:hypothetical protein
MSLVLRELERFEHRVLAALRILDGATGAAVDQPLRVSAAQARILRNRSGLYVISEWSTLAAHAAAFTAPPAAPVLGSETLSIAITDPSGRYLPCSVAVELPRDPAPANAANLNSLFRAIDVPVYPSSIAPVVGNWAAVRVTLTESNSGDVLGGAFLRVVSGGQVLARGLTDWRGEALVPVVGIPVTTWSTEPDAVIVSEIAATLQAAFDTDTGMRLSAEEAASGRAPPVLPRVNPAALEQAFAGLPQASTAVMLAAGRPLHVALQINLS